MRCLSVTLFVAGVLSSLVISGVLYLSHNESARHQFFASCLHMAVTHAFPPQLHQGRFAHIQQAEGIVVEIGPGTGVNMESYAKNNKITEYIAIEPNLFMQQYILNATQFYQIKFPYRIIGSGAENMSALSDASADTVISTHVLCSVNNINKVLLEVIRILKPGGKFLFFEHVAADDHSMTRGFQKLFQPVWTIVADGCGFRETPNELKQLKAAFSELTVIPFEAPLPFFLSPHIRGIAIKKK